MNPLADRNSRGANAERRGRTRPAGQAVGPRLVQCVLAALFAHGAVADRAGGQQIAPNVSSAQPNGFVVQVPNNKVVSRRSGLQLEVDSRWVNNYGYRPIHVRVTSRKPTKAEHVVTVRLYVASSNWGSGSTAVEQDFVLPLGATSADTVIACPQFHAGHRYWWDVWVDGVKDKDLCVAEATAWNFTAASGVSVPIPSQNLKFLMLRQPPGLPRQVTNTGDDLFEWIGLSIADLPVRWIDYTAFDVIALTSTELIVLAETQPDAWQAIRRWAWSGGQLWVSEAGRDWERLGEVERLLEMPASAPNDADPQEDDGFPRRSDAEIARRGWKPVALTPRSTQIASKTFIHLPTGSIRVVRDATVIAQLERDPDYVVQSTADSEALANVDRSRLPADSSRWFVDQRLGLGTVRVFRLMFDPAGVAVSWRMLLGIGVSPPNTSPPTPIQVAMNTMRGWGSRHGMTPDTANYDFANLLVPGVGQAPVTEFRVLITLFVLAIGPGNYWLLKRTNRLQLLVLTVPLLAAVLTIGLFGYALVSDGLGTRVRIRSFTALDQRTGDAVCWSRLSYYAGLAPSRGLTLPDDLAVYPIHSGWNESPDRSRSKVSRQMEWRPASAYASGEQRMAQGWLRSRTPTQYLTVRSRKSPHRLRLRPKEDRLTATNKLGAKIRYLAVVDEQGSFAAAEGVADGASLELQPVTGLDVLKKLRPLVLANEPELPIGLAEDSSPFFALQRRQQRRWYRRNFGLEYSTEALMGNLLEESIAALVGAQGRSPLDLPPRSYVAITETGPEVAIGVPRATEVESFHVLVGRW